MELLEHKIKAEMEECKRRARLAGLRFSDNTLEYIVTNRDLLELSPKIMIPTLYDYWAQDIEMIKNKWIYEIFPHNPYETVINTRPPISFYNIDNADWLNVMIFYHVLAHMDFFQNNVFFRRTWDDDFCGQALADKRLINSIREELGSEKRWVDYVIEFAKNIENLVGYHQELKESDKQDASRILGIISGKTDFYFNQFLKERYDAGAVELKFYYDEIDRYNQCGRDEIAFFENHYFINKFPEFNDVFKKWKEKEHKPKPKDILEYLMEESEFLNKEKNKWMKDVIQVIRRTSLYFQPQIRTKIANEGWASLWNERLFIPDPRIKSHEVDYAVNEAGVSSDRRIGLNVYAIGKHLWEFIEELAMKGKLSPEYQLIKDLEIRKRYDRKMGEDYGKKVLFEARKYFDDYLLINFLSDDDFQDFVNEYKLWIVGIRPNFEKWPPKANLYIKNKSGKYYRDLLNKNLYHPPYIDYESKSKDGEMYLNHKYEGRTLYTKYIPAVLIGLEFFLKKPVQLETTEYEYEEVKMRNWQDYFYGIQPKYRKARVLYTCQNKKVVRKIL
jgi:stage V sporulation protein R